MECPTGGEGASFAACRRWNRHKPQDNKAARQFFRVEIGSRWRLNRSDPDRMKQMMKLSLLAMLIATASTTFAAPANPIYRVAGKIAGPDGGGWDYASVDATARRLYIARSSSVTVVDIAAEKALDSVGSFVHGHAVLPVSAHRLLVTSGDDATTRFIDRDDGREVGRLAVGKKPDAAIQSADGRRAYVMNADSGSVTVIDVASMKIVRTITVKPALEYAALTPDGLFINDEDANEIEAVDLTHDKAPVPIALSGCEAPSGLGYDAASGHLIAACANGKAAIVDARHRRLVGLVDIGLGPDAVIVDAARRLAFIPCGKDAVIDILSLDGAQVKRIGRVKTEVGAKTGALDPVSGAIYLPTAEFAPPVKPGARRQPVAGTFHVLVVRPTDSVG